MGNGIRIFVWAMASLATLIVLLSAEEGFDPPRDPNDFAALGIDLGTVVPD